MTMALTNEIIKQRLIEKFGEQVTAFDEPYSMLSFEAPKELNLKVLNFLYDDEELKFRFMTDLTGVHYPDNKGRTKPLSARCTYRNTGFIF